MPVSKSTSSNPIAHALVRGVTLIELMVGLVIGLIAVLVISQVMLSAEAQKRSTTSGSDAQLTGTLALYTLQRDLQMAGYGTSASQVGLGCAVRSLRFNAGNGGAERPLAPVVITPAATTGAPDTLRVLGSSTDRFSVPTLITSDHPKTGAVGVTEFVVANTVGVRAGDLMIAVPPAPDAANKCTMFVASGVGVAPPSILHAGGDPLGWNGSGSGAAQTLVSNLFPAAGYPASSYLVNLGAGLFDRTYSISGGSLRMAEFDNATAAALDPVEQFPQVVSMRALYGKDTTPASPSLPDGSVDIYDNSLPTTPEAWARVVTIRVALVVRSGQYEQDIVTPVAPEWDFGATAVGASVAGVKTCASGAGKCIDLKLDGDINATDWKHYRYKVYDTVIPVRNLVWRS